MKSRKRRSSIDGRSGFRDLGNGCHRRISQNFNVNISPPWQAIASFFLLEMLVSFPAKIAMMTGAKWGQWNWIWPVCLVIGCAIAIRIWSPLHLPRDRLARGGALAFLVYILFLLFYCLAVGLPAKVLFSGFVLNTFIFQLVVSFAEEWFYRRIGIEYISSKEPFRFPLWAILSTSAIFGLGHGLNPLLLGNGSFGWVWFCGTFIMGMVLGSLYWKTRSVTLVGFLHFIINTGGVFIIPASKLIEDLLTVGHILQ